MKTLHNNLQNANSPAYHLMLRLVIIPGLALGALLFCSGCTHSLEVKNLGTYRSTSIVTLKKPLTIGVVQTPEDVNCQELVKGIGQALIKNAATVYLPYVPSRDKQVDVVANIKLNPKYSGSGYNFLINWPGFLVWAPAWNGYVYKADYQIEVALTKGADGAKIDAWTMPINLDLRHAEFDRTWTEIGWLEYGVIPLIGGVVFIQYDPDVTPILVEKIASPIGEHVAQEIIKRLNNSETLASSVIPPTAGAEPAQPEHPQAVAPQ